jgi:ribosome-associated toxin RatA of RatAB toxin-antitoxin module
MTAPESPPRNEFPRRRQTLKPRVQLRSKSASRARLWTLAVAVIAVFPATAATISVDAERRGDNIEIHASAELKSDAATAWRVLTDYERYPEFIPDLRVSRVVSRQGQTVVVEQSGDATLWLLKIPLDITFEITETSPNAIKSRGVAGSLKSMSSGYLLTPVPHGVRLEYEGRVVPGFELFAPFELTAVQQSIARQFQALADEIERRSTGAATPADAVTR